MESKVQSKGSFVDDMEFISLVLSRKLWGPNSIPHKTEKIDGSCVFHRKRWHEQPTSQNLKTLRKDPDSLSQNQTLLGRAGFQIRKGILMKERRTINAEECKRND